MKKAKLFISNMVFMFRYSWKYARGRYLIAVIMITLDSVQPLFSVIMPKYIIDELTGEKRWDIVMLYVGLLFLVNLTISTIRNLIKYFDEKSEYKYSWDIKIHQARIMSNLDYSFIENSSAKDKVEQALTNTNPFAFVNYSLTGFVTTIIKLAGYTYIISTLHPAVILVLLALIAIFTVITKKRKKLAYIYEPIFIRYTRLFKYLMGTMIRFEFGKEVRINGASIWLEEKFLSELDGFMKKGKEVDKTDFKLSIIENTIAFIQIGLMYGYSVFKVINKDITVGGFSVYISAISLFCAEFQSLTSWFVDIGYINKHVNGLKDLGIDVFSESGNKDGQSFGIKSGNEHEIVFDNVSFIYPNTEKWVLKNVNIKISTGEKLSVVGYNGAGKTTFIKLICRLYEPTEGKIYYNGIDISTINLSLWRRVLSVVFQDFALFHFSVKDNIALDSYTDDQKLDVAVEKSGLSEKISSLPLGYETPVSKDFEDTGVEFSGGEGQKLAIARAFHKDAPIIILDEPTAALDPISESQIYEQFNNIVGGKTAIYISHRLASVKFCDKVAVFIDGRIEEYGSHDELLAKGGVYADMFHKQSEFYNEVAQSEKE